MFDIGDIIFQSLKEEAPFNQAVSHSGQQTPTESMISGINHVGIYIGQNVVIDSTPKEGVIEQTLHDFLASLLPVITTCGTTRYDGFTPRTAAKTTSSVP